MLFCRDVTHNGGYIQRSSNAILSTFSKFVFSKPFRYSITIDGYVNIGWYLFEIVWNFYVPMENHRKHFVSNVNIFVWSFECVQLLAPRSSRELRVPNVDFPNRPPLFYSKLMLAPINHSPDCTKNPIFKSAPRLDHTPPFVRSSWRYVRPTC